MISEALMSNILSDYRVTLGISNLSLTNLYLRFSTMDDETAEIELVRTFSITDSRLVSFLDDMSSWNRISTRHAKYLRE